jgi:hypothetical protein
MEISVFATNSFGIGQFWNGKKLKAFAKDAMIAYRKAGKRNARARLVAMHVDARAEGKIELVLQVERTDNWGENIRIPL